MRVAVLTGASRGIGAELARRITAECDLTIAIGRREPLHRAGLFLAADLTDTGAVLERLGASKHLRGEDLWFFDVAGVLPRTARGRGFVEAAHEAYAVNTVTPLAIGHLLAGQADHLTIVHLTSGAARRAIASWGAYGMSKAAAAMGWRTFELEWPNASVHLVDPGVVDTDMQRSLREAHDPLAAPVEQLKSAGVAAEEILAQVGFRA